MDTTLYTVWKPKNIVIILSLTLVINAILFMGLPILTRMADRGRDTKKDTDYVLTAHEAPKKREDNRERRLRRKELKQIPRTKMESDQKKKMDALKFAFDPNADSVGGLEVAMMSTEGMDIDVGDLTFSLGDVDSPPRVIRAPPVNPPYAAVSKGITGRVIVRIRVGVDGKATRIKAIRAEPPEVLEVFGEVAEKGVARYRFEPARLGGEAVPVWAQQPITFELH